MSGVSYVVTSYQEVGQILRLCKTLRLQSPRARIVVSHDLGGCPIDTQPFDRAGVEVVLTRHPVRWGDGSYLRSVLDVLSLLELSEDSWAMLLTAQDYPLRPLVEFERHVIESEADALMNLQPPSPQLSELLERYSSRSIQIPRVLERRPFPSLVSRLRRLGLPVSFHPQPHGLPPRLDVMVGQKRLRGRAVHKGTDLYAVNGRSARALLGADKELREFFMRTRIPSEAYPHTVLMNKADISVSNERLHYAVWHGGSHPEWLSLSHMEEALASKAWFARKFRPGDPALDVLDAVLRQ